MNLSLADAPSGELGADPVGQEISKTFSKEAESSSVVGDGVVSEESDGASGNLQKVLRRAAASGAIKGLAMRHLRHLVR
ncbi:MAG: hypothetical protein RBR86_00930 [Pseudobdellovibrionaceae bacterium]|jgi:hypothetical protein|nr:hypothetical protein [Pseudobdellovibrionaceae bacterium]